MEQPVVGASAPYTDTDVLTIFTGRGGQWECSPSFTGRKLIASAQIRLTGSRRRDYLDAENITHVQHTPRVTVWHHVYNFDAYTDECTMQLVRWKDHVNTIPHTGGCKEYAEHYGVRYRLTPPDGKTLPPVCEVPAYSAKELDEFSSRTGLSLTPELRRFYSGDFRLSQSALAYAAQKDFLLDAVLPLCAQDGASMEELHQLLKNLPCAAPLKDMRAVGISVCGDFFCADENGEIWFYDHEADQYCETDLDLDQLRE